MKCKCCQKEIVDGATFCPFCGLKLSAAQEEKEEPFEPFRESDSLKAEKSIEKLNESEKKLQLSSKIVRPISIVLVILAVIAYYLLGSAILGGILIAPVVISEGILLYKKRKLFQKKDSLKLNEENTETKKSDEPIRKESESMDNSEKEIKSYLITNILWSAIWGIGALLFGLLLFFLPFFSMIFENVSVFDLTKESMVWEIFQRGSKEYVYRNLLIEVLQEGKLSSLGIFEDIEGYVEVYFSISILFVMFFAFIPLIVCLYYGYRWYKFTNDDDYKRAIIYRYREYSSGKRKPYYSKSKTVFIRLLAIIVLLQLWLPTIDLLITLPRYFDGLTNSFFYVCLIFFLLFIIVSCVGERLLNFRKKYTYIGWAFAKDKQIK